MSEKLLSKEKVDELGGKTVTFTIVDGNLMRKEGKPEELKTFLENDLEEQGIQEKDIKLVIDHFLENAKNLYSKSSTNTSST